MVSYQMFIIFFLTSRIKRDYNQNEQKKNTTQMQDRSIIKIYYYFKHRRESPKMQLKINATGSRQFEHKMIRGSCQGQDKIEQNIQEEYSQNIEEYSFIQQAYKAKI